MYSKALSFLLLGLLALAALSTRAETLAETGWRDLNRAVVDGHIVPRYRLLDSTARTLDSRLRQLCEGPTDMSLALVRDGFRATLSAWNGISHIRFGPVETEQRYFRFQLWPDKRGTGSRQVRELLAETDSVRFEPQTFVKESVAVQGLSALEMLLFPEGEVTPADFAGSHSGADGDAAGNRCRFARAIGGNISNMAVAVLADWTQGKRPYRDILLDPQPGPAAASSRAPAPVATASTTAGSAASPASSPSPDPARFVDDRTVSAELLRSLHTGVQVVHQQKLAEPLGASAETANARKAESWRSLRSLANVCTNLRALQHLYETGFALVLSETAESAEKDLSLSLTFAAATHACLAQPPGLLDEPVNSEQRSALEDLRELAGALQARTGRTLAVELDLTLGFNSLDGD